VHFRNMERKKESKKTEIVSRVKSGVEQKTNGAGRGGRSNATTLSNLSWGKGNTFEGVEDEMPFVTKEGVKVKEMELIGPRRRHQEFSRILQPPVDRKAMKKRG